MFPQGLYMANKQLERKQLYLDVEGSALDLRGALPDDEGDSVGAVLGCLGEVDAKQMQSSLELLVATLDGQRLQTLFVAGQGTLGNAEEKEEDFSQFIYIRFWVVR